MKQAISVEATAVPYKAIVVWEVLPDKSGGTGFTAAYQAQAIPPTSNVVKYFDAAAYVGKISRSSAGPRGVTFLPMEVRLRPSNAPPIFSIKSICTVDSLKKPGNLTIPVSVGRASVNLNSESGLIDGIPPSLDLPAALPVAPELRPSIGSWRAASRKPYAPNVPGVSPVSCVPKRFAPAHFPGRCQPVNESVVPYRSWYSLTLSESPSGFVFAAPSPGTSDPAMIGSATSFGTWRSRINSDFPGMSLLDQSDAYCEELKPTADGAQTLLPILKPLASVVPFQPGLANALHGEEPFLKDESPFVKDVETASPAARAALTPRPVMAFSTGFLAWSDPVNSYVRRNPGAPRFRDNSRIVHALRLAPAGQF